jgi:hypothetical protein
VAHPIEQPTYPVAHPTDQPSDPPVVPEGASPTQVLQDIGLPWAGIDRVIGLQPGSLRRQVWAAGPQGLFRLHVPQGFGVLGEHADDFWLVRLNGPNTRMLHFRTLTGVACDPDLLSSLRSQRLARALLETRTLSVGGRTVSALVFQAPQGNSQLEEVFWSHSDPDWTVAVSGACPGQHFAEFQANFERTLQNWNP